MGGSAILADIPALLLAGKETAMIQQKKVDLGIH
jgi:hypothetical protein